MALVKLVVHTPRKLLEVVSAVLFEAGAGGIEELDNGRCLVVYVASKEEAEGVAARARELLREAAPEPSGVTLSVEVDEKSDWDTAWTKHLGQVALTPRIVIQPLWDETPTPIGSRRILFDPKLAFGDGAHPTTRLAAEFLETQCERWPDARVLDFGSGTGVLAFVALLSGAEFACGVDIDPVSVAAAQRNAELNGFRAVTRFCLPHQLEPGDFDLVVANLEAPVMLRAASEIARLSACAKTVILTGFLNSRAREIVTAFGPGFDVGWRARAGEWALALLEPKR